MQLRSLTTKNLKMSTNLYHSPGLGNVGSYQMSARPYLTSSLSVPFSSATPLEISFDTVTSFVVITNTLPGSATNEKHRAFSQHPPKNSS